jgi:hypothetical protein
MNTLDKPAPDNLRSTNRNFIRVIVAIVLVAGVLVFAPLGCVPRRPPTTTQTKTAAEPTARPVDESTLAFESLRNLNNPAAIERDALGRTTNKSADRAIFYLNQWLARQDVDAVKWELDPLFKQLPRSVRESRLFQDLDELDFYTADVTYLQQCLWENDVADRIVKEKPAPHLAGWLKELEDEGQIDAARQLAQAERLFDWAVRNIQLTPLLPVPKGLELNVEEGKKLDTRSPAERGFPGPGYQQLPQQTLQFGRGDAWERGRIFIHLCRQASIPAMMLGISRPNELGGPQAWAAAVLIGGELYVFDPLLGLPIPGPERAGIATLKQLIADEALLKALQPEEGEPYRVSLDDLKHVGILLDVQPEALARRMHLLEEPLNYARSQSRTEKKSEGTEEETAKLPIVLAARPSELEPALRKLKHISSVGLWRIPFEAVQYAQMLPQIAQEKPELMQELNERMAIMTAEQMIYLGASQTVDRSLQAGQEQRQKTPRNVTLSQGRDYVLRGRFEDWESRPGARSVFLSFRPSEQLIDMHESSVKFINERFAEDPVMQKRWKDNDQQRAADMMHIGRTMRLSKSHATYWLGLTYFETNQYQNTIEWLEPLALGAADTGPWQAGARYLTARSYEALGKNDKAREFYLADDSPQAAGNKLRASWLK